MKSWTPLVAFVVGTVLLSGCTIPSPPAALSVEALKDPMVVAHRGGANKYPESSIEAFKAVSTTDFPIEMDLRSLKDGTLVPQHDPLVDRNMIGISGPIGAVSLEDWRQAKIKGINGSAPGTPTTWDSILDEFGGQAILVPELKETTTDLAEFAASITDRGLQSSIIVQSFDVETCKQLAKLGLHVLYLFGDKQPAPADLKSWGVEYVGPAKTVNADYLRSLASAGIKAWPWTVNDSKEAQILIDGGAAGVFSDDPWLISKEITATP